jgi:hypothetical protein
MIPNQKLATPHVHEPTIYKGATKGRHPRFDDLCELGWGQWSSLPRNRLPPRYEQHRPSIIVVLPQRWLHQSAGAELAYTTLRRTYNHKSAISVGGVGAAILIMKAVKHG